MCVSVCITITGISSNWYVWFLFEKYIIIHVCNSLIIDGFVLSFACVYTAWKKEKEKIE